MSVLSHIPTGTTTYSYRATSLSVTDGDTAKFSVDCGLETYRTVIGRFYGINCPEVIGATKAAGLASKAFTASKLPVGGPVTLTTIKDRTEKYGRYLLIITLPDGTVLNDELLTQGLAVEYYP